MFLRIQLETFYFRKTLARDRFSRKDMCVLVNLIARFDSDIVWARIDKELFKVQKRSISSLKQELDTIWKSYNQNLQQSY